VGQRPADKRRQHLLCGDTDLCWENIPMRCSPDFWVTRKSRSGNYIVVVWSIMNRRWSGWKTN